MNYPLKAQIVNIVFLLIVFISPIIIGLNISVQFELSRTILVICWALGAFLIGDWYYSYQTNTLRSCIVTIICGIVVTCISLGVKYSISGLPLPELVKFHQSWLDHAILVKIYVVGLGIFSCGVISLPRLFFIKIFTNKKLPQPR